MSRSIRGGANGVLSRRVILKGIGGATLALPFFEGLAPRRASAAAEDYLPFAIFFRQADGVACAQTNEELGTEPERFWPRNPGVLDAANVEGRALDELSDHLSNLLVVRNVHMEDYAFGDGHARGALQVLTARGPFVANVGGDSEASGESIDHRIGRELNPNGRDSLFMYAGEGGGWLGGPCVSYRGPNDRRSALHDPWQAYETMVGSTGGLSPEAIERLRARNHSVNDLVKGQLESVLRSRKLSQRDRDRLDLHLTSVRDIETKLSCRLNQTLEAELQGLGDIYESTDGDFVLETVRHHMDLAVVAVACGYTRSVAIQLGNGNDAATRFRDPDTGQQMENYHYISHRRLSHDASGGVIAGSDLLHHKIDRQFAQTFRYLIEKLKAYDVGGSTLLDRGVAIWHNDLGNGPGHGSRNIPWVMAGSCAGYFKQGQCVELTPGESEWGAPLTHARVLNTIGTAVGCRTEGQSVLNDFGDPELPREPHPALQA